MKNPFSTMLSIFKTKQSLTDFSVLESRWIEQYRPVYMDHRVVSDQDIFRAYVGHRADSDKYHVIKLIDKQRDILYLLTNGRYYYRESITHLAVNLMDCVYLDKCYTEPFDLQKQRMADNKVRELIHKTVILHHMIALHDDKSVPDKYKALDPYYEQLRQRMYKY